MDLSPSMESDATFIGGVRRGLDLCPPTVSFGNYSSPAARLNACVPAASGEEGQNGPRWELRGICFVPGAQATPRWAASLTPPAAPAQAVLQPQDARKHGPQPDGEAEQPVELPSVLQSWAHVPARPGRRHGLAPLRYLPVRRGRGEHALPPQRRRRPASLAVRYPRACAARLQTENVGPGTWTTLPSASAAVAWSPRCA
jgi:hypothetical protein